MRMPPGLPRRVPDHPVCDHPFGDTELFSQPWCQAGPLWQPFGTAMSDWTFSEIPRAQQTGAPALWR
jgi:hypothetical protein